MTHRANRRDRWVARVTTTRLLPTACKLFCVGTLSRDMKANGMVSVPRQRLADAAGVSERRVTTFVQQAKTAGFLVVVSPGYRTSTAVYQATFPDAESGNSTVPSIEPERGKSTDPLSTGTPLFPLSTGESGNPVVPTTSKRTTTRCTGDGETCPCRHCFDWRIAVGVVLKARPHASDLDLDTSTKSKNHLRAVN